jgi:hypothetical protein
METKLRAKYDKIRKRSITRYITVSDETVPDKKSFTSARWMNALTILSSPVSELAGIYRTTLLLICFLFRRSSIYWHMDYPEQSFQHRMTYKQILLTAVVFRQLSQNTLKAPSGTETGAAMFTNRLLHFGRLYQHTQVKIPPFSKFIRNPVLSGTAAHLYELRHFILDVLPEESSFIISY